MPRPRKPASLQSGHHMNKEQRQNAIAREKFLGGSANIIAKPPEYLSKRAKHYYRFIYSHLKETGVLRDLDVFVLSQTAICLDHMKTCDEIIDQDGMTIFRYTRSGEKIPYEHPTVNTKKKYMSDFFKLSTQLGLTPSSRNQLASVNDDSARQAKDPLNKIMSRLHSDKGSDGKASDDKDEKKKS